MTADSPGRHEAVEAPVPRRREAGVMGYVAELQQFDDSMTAPGERPTIAPGGTVPPGGASPQGPASGSDPAHPRDHMPPAGRGGGDAVEPPLPAGGPRFRRDPGIHGSPRTGAASGVPAKPGRPPWTRTEIGLAVVFVLVAAVAIVGGGYAVLLANRPPTGEVPLPLPSLEAAGEQDPPATAVPTPGGRPGPGPGVEPSASAAPRGGADPSTADSAAPGAGASPTTAGPSTPPPAADLVASYSREANTGLLGLTGYRGEVTITNRGRGAADGWTVTLSLPGGQRVDSVRGAEARQEGELVTFTPLAGRGTVAAGGSVSFTFEVPGLLAGEPTGCAIDGRPCE